MKEAIIKKGLVVGIILLFLGASVIPAMSGDNKKTNTIKKEKNTNNQQPIQKNPLILCLNSSWISQPARITASNPEIKVPSRTPPRRFKPAYHVEKG